MKSSSREDQLLIFHDEPGQVKITAHRIAHSTRRLEIICKSLISLALILVAVPACKIFSA